MSLRVAVVGAGPAGIYASDLLIRNEEHDIHVDLFEQMPAPFGLIRYGVAPDHPRIKGIVKSLHNVLDKDKLRLIANVTVGRDVTINDLRDYYDAVVLSTGAVRDRELLIPGGDKSIGAGEFVGFYDGNPRFERDWNLEAKEVAVVGVGNVALDVSRILAKTGDELAVTEIPDNVYESLKNNMAETVHMFGRRGPAQAKFTPKELRELDGSDTIQVLVDPEDIDYDELSEQVRRSDKSVDLNCQVLEQYAMREPDSSPHKIYIHFFEEPVEVLTEGDAIVGIRTERQELDGNGGIRGTGQHQLRDELGIFGAGHRPALAKPHIVPVQHAEDAHRQRLEHALLLRRRHRGGERIGHDPDQDPLARKQRLLLVLRQQLETCDLDLMLGIGMPVELEQGANDRPEALDGIAGRRARLANRRHQRLEMRRQDIEQDRLLVRVVVIEQRLRDTARIGDRVHRRADISRGGKIGRAHV